MRLVTAFIPVALLAASAAADAATYQRGDWVLSQFAGSKYWFAGVAQGERDGEVTILYDDGDRETRPVNQVKPYDWHVGTRVECNWKNRGDWYGGRITALNGGDLSVAYDDGDREDTSTGLCRSL